MTWLRHGWGGQVGHAVELSCRLGRAAPHPLYLAPARLCICHRSGQGVHTGITSSSSGSYCSRCNRRHSIQLGTRMGATALPRAQAPCCHYPEIPAPAQALPAHPTPRHRSLSAHSPMLSAQPNTPCLQGPGSLYGDPTHMHAPSGIPSAWRRADRSGCLGSRTGSGGSSRDASSSSRQTEPPLWGLPESQI